ncbi:retrovirus-related pol polyprotein from transposon TNT 1-94 [Tanacetum coccineum]
MFSGSPHETKLIHLGHNCLKGLLHMLNATMIPMQGIKSLLEDGDNLMDFYLISNLEAILREFLEDGIDFEESFALVARLEAVRMFVGYAAYKTFTISCQDSISQQAIERKSLCKQPDNFVDPDFPDHVYKLKKALYGIKKAPRAWYGKLSSFLIEHHITKDMENEVDISALTMEQYIALILDDIKPGIVNPKIGDEVEFEINSNFMREFRRKLFTGTDGEDT